MNRFNTKIGLIVVALTAGVFSVAQAHNGNDANGVDDLEAPVQIGFGMGSAHMKDLLTGGNTDLSLEDVAELRQAREEFFRMTRVLENKVDRKLGSSQTLLKLKSDRDQPFDYRKELSEIRSVFDRKPLTHQVDFRKNFLDTDSSQKYWPGMGYRW